MTMHDNAPIAEVWALYWVVPRGVMEAHGVKRALSITTDPNRKRARRTGFSAAAWEWFDRWDVLA